MSLVLDENEVKNQHVHAFWGLIAGFVVAKLSGLFLLSCLVGLFIGLCVELYQYVGPDNQELKLSDRLLDVSTWWLGGIIGTLMFYVSS